MANQNFKVKKGLEVGTGTTVSIDGINVTGVITATSFTGDGSGITGVTAEGTGVSIRDEGNPVGTAATINFIGANVTAAQSGAITNVTISAGGLSNVVEDTTPQLGGNLDLNSKDITGTGNISITGGFNATGVSTFQENVVFQTAASFGDNDKANFGAGNDLQIYHDGSNSYIDDTGTGGLDIRGNEVKISTHESETMAVFSSNAAVSLRYNNSTKFQTTNTGVTVTGTLAATALSGSLATTDLTGTITNAQLAGSIADGKLASTFLKNVVEDTTPQLGGNLDANSKDITGIANLNVAGVSTFQGNVNLLSDSSKFIAGAGGDLEIFHDGNDSGIRNNTGGLYLQNNGTIFIGDVGANEYSAKFHDNGATELYYDGTKKFETTATGVTVTGTLAATAVTGDGSGLTGLTGASAGTYGASTNTPIITVDGNGRITGISTVPTAGSGGGGFSAIIEDTTPQLGGDLDLNSKNIIGTGNIDITGYAAVSGVTTFSGIAGFGTHITLPDHAEIQIGGATGGDLKIYHDASHSYVSDEGTGNLKFRSNAFKFTNVAENKTSMVVTPPGAVELYHDNALRLTTTGVGVNVSGNVTIPNDTGKLTVGVASDLQLYHDGSNSYIDNATGHLFIRGAGGNSIKLQSPSGEDSVIADANGGVKLYYDNAKKLETVNAGVTVTGTLAATAVTGDGSGLTGLPASGISTSNTNIQASWSVTASGSSGYRFTGPGNDAGENNPDLYLVRGQRYRFTNNSGGSHPFQIRVSNGGSAYSTGVTNNGAASGNIDFNVQWDAPARLFYQCTVHGGMVGNIYIIGGPQVISGIVTATGFSGSGANLTSLPSGQLTGALPAISGASLTNVNATTLDSIDSGSFLRSDADDNAAGFGGRSNVNSSGDPGLLILNGGRLGFDQSGTRSWTIKASGGNLNVASGDGNGTFTGQINASTLDSIDSGSFLRSDAADSASGVMTFTNQVIIDHNTTTMFEIKPTNGGPWAMAITRDDLGASRVFTHNPSSSLGWIFEHNPWWYNGGSYAKFLTTADEGSGNGIDADTVDGIEASAFATLSGSNSFTNSYNEFGDSTGSVSNNGNWNARVNIAGSQHARFDVQSVSDGIVTTMYAHTGHTDGKIGTTSNHPLCLMTNGNDKIKVGTSSTPTLLIGGSFTNDAYDDTASTRLLFGGGNDPDNYFLGTNLENYGGNYTKLDLRWHTGIRIGAQPNYGGTRIYNNEDLSTLLFSVGTGGTDVTVTNNLTAGGNVTAYSSDRRLKENFKNIESPIEKISKLNGCNFDWIENIEELGFTPEFAKNDVGLIAQEVEAVCPQAVAPAPFDQEYDANAEDPKDRVYKSKSGENYLTVKYEKIVPLLVEAIKDQQKQIDELKAKLEEK